MSDSESITFLPGEFMHFWSFSSFFQVLAPYHVNLRCWLTFYNVHFLVDTDLLQLFMSAFSLRLLDILNRCDLNSAVAVTK